MGCAVMPALALNIDGDQERDPIIAGFFCGLLLNLLFGIFMVS